MNAYAKRELARKPLQNESTRTHAYVFVYIYIYIYSVCVCVYVCVQAFIFYLMAYQSSRII